MSTEAFKKRVSELVRDYGASDLAQLVAEMERDEAKSKKDPVITRGIGALRKVLTRMRWDDQGGYPSYQGNGRWSFVAADLTHVTPEELNALFALAGIEPDVIQSLGTCDTCGNARVLSDGSRVERGYQGACLACKRPRMSNFVPVASLKKRGTTA